MAPSVHLIQPKWLEPFSQAYLPAGDDASRMALAVALSAEGARRNLGGPFGAAVFDDASGELVTAGCNLVFDSGASLAHAEMVTLSFAQQREGEPDLSSRAWTLYSSSEPCAMCTAALQGQIDPHHHIRLRSSPRRPGSAGR